jgi:hypothetical protein
MDIGFRLVWFLSATVKVFAQTVAGTQLNISIAGIEYDDGGFTKLKESIKTIKKRRM